MVLRNALGAIALDATVSAGNTLLTSIRDAVQGVLSIKNSTATYYDFLTAAGVSIDEVNDRINYSSVAVQLTGTFVATLVFETSIDSTTWTPLYLINASNNQQSSSATAPGIYSGSLFGRYFRVRSTAWTSGTVSVNLLYSAAPEATSSINTSSNFNVTSTASTNSNLIVNTPRSLQELTITNPTTTPAYLKVYGKATAPTVGTDTPRFGIPIPASTTLVIDWGPNGKTLPNGIGIAITGGIALLDNTAAVAGIVVDGTYV